MGIRTAYDFSVLPREWVRRNMTVVCDPPLARDERDALHQSGTGAARQAGDMHVAGIRENDFRFQRGKGRRGPLLSSSARKLRDQHSYARRIYVGIETNPFNEYQRQTYRGLQIEFPVPTDNTFEMIPLCHDAAQSDLADLFSR